MSLLARTSGYALLPLLVLTLVACGNEEGPPGGSPSSSGRPSESPGPSRIPPTGPEVSVGPEWEREVHKSGIPIMPTR